MKAQRTGTPIRVGAITVTPIAETRLDAVRWRRGLYVWGSVGAVAVLIRRDDHEERVDLCGSSAQMVRFERRGHE